MYLNGINSYKYLSVLNIKFLNNQIRELNDNVYMVCPFVHCLLYH